MSEENVKEDSKPSIKEALKSGVKRTVSGIKSRVGQAWNEYQDERSALQEFRKKARREAKKEVILFEEKERVRRAKERAKKRSQRQGPGGSILDNPALDLFISPEVRKKDPTENLLFYPPETRKKSRKKDPYKEFFGIE